MEEVSIGSVKIVCAGLSEFLKIPSETILQDSPLPNLLLEKDSEWLSWNQFVDWLNWFDHSQFAPIDWRMVGTLGFQKKNIPVVTAFCRMAFSVRFSYWIAAKWFGPSQFRVISCVFEDIDKGKISETLEVPKSLKPCQQVFKIFEGSLSILPQIIFGLPVAQVIAEISGHKATYTIDLPFKVPFKNQITNALRSTLHLNDLFGELAKQQDEIHFQSIRLLQERSEIKNILSHFPDGMLIHQNEKIIYANNMLAMILNYSSSNDLVGRSYRDFISNDHPFHSLQQNQADLSCETPTKHFHEISFLKRDSNETVDCEYTRMSLSYDGAKSELIVVRDISERKKYQSHLLATDRLANLGRLAAGVGHEINNPLCYVMLKLEILRERFSTDPSVDSKFEEITYGLNRIQTIVKDLKTLSRGSTDEKLDLVDVAAILKSAILISNNEIQHRAILEVKIAELPKIWANESRLGQVFLNLLVNAAQAIEPGNAIKNKICVKAFSSNEKVIIQISDSGPGIPELLKKNIFKAFYTTKPIGQGTGLGLSICHSIVDNYKGQIHFDSQVGVGTTFTVAFPAAQELRSVSALDLSTPKLNIPELKNRRVMIIDDDPLLLETLEQVISNFYQTQTFLDASLALQKLNDGDVPDVILCDMMMPNMGGIEFFKALSRNKAFMCRRVIFLTGGSFTSQTDQFLLQPHLKVCTKPIARAALLKIIGDLILEPEHSDHMATPKTDGIA